jgi:hypothetical protein
LYCIVLLALGGCALNRAGIGALYMDVTAADTITAQANMKKGEACATSFLGLVATGDAGIGTAAKNGGIVSVGAVDVKDSAFLFGLYWSHCTIVHGK